MNLEDVLRKNKSLNNIHAGKRCFLVGNGPSLNTQDITLLKDEIVIVATSFFRHKHAKIVNPQYWVFADPYFWKEPDRYFMPNFKHAMDKSCNTKLFMPSAGFSHFANFAPGPLIDLHFYHYDQQQGIESGIDFSSGILPYGQNTMTVCLMLALFLGCNPIYFIGCDREYWNVTRKEYETAYKAKHFFEDPTQNTCVEHLPWEQWLRAKARTGWEYDQLKQYAALRGFDIYNATRGGFFDNFPRIDYESLFAPSMNLLTGGTMPGKQDQRDAHHLGTAVIQLMNAGDHVSADALLDEAIRHNINTPQRVEGLRYVKALCVAKFGKYEDALIQARCDYTTNPSNRDKSEPLIQQLESVCGIQTGGISPA